MRIQRRIAAVLIFFSTLLFAVTLHSGEPGGSRHKLKFFPLHPAMTAYTSEIRSTVNRFELQTANTAPPQYPWSGGFEKRILLNIQFGAEIPIIGGDSEHWLWYIGFPISFNLLNDFFEKTTAPVMNTDYWFGTRLEALYRLDIPWPRNIAVRILPFFHESTHIGDELALRMADENSAGYYRINVSYEAWEITVGLDEWESGNGNAFNLRLGMSGRWNSDGYYSPPHPAELGSSLLPSDIIPSRSGMEYFGQFNTVIVSGFPAIGSWMFQGGLELRNRILFDYFSTAPEKRVWTVNSTLGWYRYPEGSAGRRLGFYLKFLAGQNPHGQFREQDGYFVFGTGFSLGI